MSTGSDDFELNLAPIIDCFTVLITYLLLSASFITLGMLSVTTVSNAENTDSVKPPDFIVTLQLTPQHDFFLHMEKPGYQKSSVKIVNQNGAWDYNSLETKLKDLKGQLPGLETLMVASDDRLEYSDLVKAIDYSSKVFSTVAIKTQPEPPP